MNAYSSFSRHALILTTTCLLLFSTYPASPAMGSDAQSRRAAVTTFALVRSAEAPARLIVGRLPGLGNNVIVNLYVDGVFAAAIGYGHTYNGFLPPGRHVLSVLATPRAKWSASPGMILDARNGQTYVFTARGDSGNLILQPPGAPERPGDR
jgi:hypothetical protein